MKRDLELIREILLRTEKRDRMQGYDVLDVPGYRPDVVSYHIYLLAQEGFLESHELESGRGSPKYGVRFLTMRGHELLDAVRNVPVWNQLRRSAQEQHISLTLEVAQALLKEYAAGKLDGLDDAS